MIFIAYLLCHNIENDILMSPKWYRCYISERIQVLSFSVDLSNSAEVNKVCPAPDIVHVTVFSARASFGGVAEVGMLAKRVACNIKGSLKLWACTTSMSGWLSAGYPYLNILVIFSIPWNSAVLYVCNWSLHWLHHHNVDLSLVSEHTTLYSFHCARVMRPWGLEAYLAAFAIFCTSHLLHSRETSLPPAPIVNGGLPSIHNKGNY